MFSNSEIENIYNLYVDDMFAYATYLGFDRWMVMDAIHDVFVKLCSDESMVTENINNIKFYLLRALRNTLINISQRSANRSVDISELKHSYEDGDLADAVLLTHEKELSVKNKIDNLMKSLTKRQAEIVYLRYVEEYSYEEISDIMKITPGACRKLMHKAMKALRSANTD